MSVCPLPAGRASGNKLPGSFLCPQCGKTYRYKGSLSQHMRLECGKEPQFACPADQCTYRSKQRSGVYRHVRMLHPELAEMAASRHAML